MLRPLTLLLLLVLAAPAVAWHPAQDPTPRPTEASDQVVRGRLVDADGRPLAGVALELECRRVWPDGPGYRIAPQPMDLETLGPTDAEGRFEFPVAVDPPRQAVLRVSIPGRERLEWKWLADEGRPDLDLGTTVVHEEAVLEGYVEDEDGDLLADGCFVDLIPRERPSGPRAAVRHRLELDPDRPWFRFEGLSPGAYDLSATCLGHAWIQGPVVHLLPGDVRSWVLEEGWDRSLEGTLSVRVETDGPIPYRAERGTVVAVDRTGRELRMRSSEPDRWSLDEVGHGPYEVRVEDPAWPAARFGGLELGPEATVVLAGGAAVRLELGFPGDAAPEGIALDLSMNLARGRSGRRPTGVERVPLSRFEGGLVGGLPLGDLTIVVRAPGFPTRTVVVPGLVKGEERPVRVDLPPPGGLSVKVRTPAGEPVAGVPVQVAVPGDVVLGGRTPNGRDSWGLAPDLDPVDVLARTTTDEAGRAFFQRVPAGRVLVRSARGPHVFEELEVEVRPFEVTRPVLVLPVPCRVQVTPKWPSDPGSGGGGVILWPVRSTRRPSWVEALAPTGRLPKPVDGTWTFEGVRPGPCTLLIRQGRDRDPRVLQVEVVEVPSTEHFTLEPDLTGLTWSRGVAVARARGALLRDVGLEFVPTPDPDDAPGAPHLQEPARDPVHRIDAVRSGCYHLRVFSLDHGWTWTDPRVHTFVPDEPFDLEVDVPLVPCLVRLVDPDGRPWRGHSVRLCPEGARTGAARHVPDAWGRLELHLPPGPYQVVDSSDVPARAPVHPDARVARSRFEVPDSETPVELEVVLRPPE